MLDWLSDVTLEEGNVRLRPMVREYRDAIISAASDGELWNLWYTSVPSSGTIDSYFNKALSDKRRGLALPFVVEDIDSGKIIGSTRYCNADNVNKRLEIGYTWYAKSYQRTAVNTTCKLLLLSHAFEKLDCIAVEFRTHHANKASQAAIQRLGARQDGILRQHQRMADGNYRDTYVYSILNSEWKEIKTSLSEKVIR